MWAVGLCVCWGAGGVYGTSLRVYHSELASAAKSFTFFHEQIDEKELFGAKLSIDSYRYRVPLTRFDMSTALTDPRNQRACIAQAIGYSIMPIFLHHKLPFINITLNP